MTFDAHKNFALSAISNAPSPATTGLTMIVVDASVFPAVPFNATIWPATSGASVTNAEIVRVTGITGNVITVVRAQEGSTARAVLVGDQIAATLTVKAITDIENAVGIGLPTGWTEDGSSPANVDMHGATLDVDGGHITNLTDPSNPQDAATKNYVDTHGGGGGGGGAVYDYVERTTDLSVTATSEPTAQTFIDGNPVTYDGSTEVKIEAWCQFASPPAGQWVILTLWDGATDLGRIGQTGVTGGATVKGERILTPSAGAHTYHVKAWVTSGTGTLYAAAASGALPSFLRITTADVIEGGIPSGHEFDYVERTTNLSVTATTEAGSDVFIDGNAVTFDGATRVKIEVWVPVSEQSQFCLLSLWDGGTDLGLIVDSGGGAGDVTVYGARFLTPSAGSHTYHVKAYRGTGSATLYAGSGGVGNYLPAWYRITKA
jgi:hypothetical protein